MFNRKEKFVIVVWIMATPLGLAKYFSLPNPGGLEHILVFGWFVLSVVGWLLLLKESKYRSEYDAYTANPHQAFHHHRLPDQHIWKGERA